ncbi:SAM-dependent methyltransferase [Paenibacillus thailandensis]|uniref:SAM-dependent methyltransferase n=1 Tax=Paenibacillus thailandensis TaxID=393250 RepID=A0ABW5QWD5_9BACL
MNSTETFLQILTEYLDKFTNLAAKYDGTIQYSKELETTIDGYSAFITDERNHSAWEQLERQASNEFIRLAAEARSVSARCVAIMEKYRALKLLDGNAGLTDYFKNIESCIESEFGSFHVTSDSKVFMVGSGSFPMTPLLIAKRTGAEVIGIDIDDEAVELGRRVVERLGGGLRIRLVNSSIDHLDLKNVSHIIFSSTVPNKYDMLEQLHPLTEERVVVAMRYGDRLKSLFNYPMKETDGQTWGLVETVLRPGHVFDVALYKKVSVASGQRRRFT